MSSLTKAITIVHLAQQLKPDEFEQFLSKFIAQLPCGRDIILGSIFAHFTHSKPSITNVKQIDNVIQTISDIIQTRPDSNMTCNMHINDLNDNIIGKISSYLNQKDYVHFSITTRSIFIGSNSPNTLQQINLDLFNKPYSSINLQLFPMVKHMEFDSEKFGQIQFIPKNIQHIRLNGLFKRNSLEKFMNGVNFEVLKSLQFVVPYYNNNNNTNRTPGKLYPLFSKFSAVEHLELDENFNVDFTGNETKNLFPNLKSFYNNGSRFGYGIINKYSNKLNGLRFHDNNGYSLATDSKFEQLNELTIFKATKCTIEHILKSAKNLRKIRLSSNMNKHDFENSIKALLSSQPSLNYISVLTTVRDMRFESVFIGIEKGLFHCKKYKKDYFKMKVEIQCGKIHANNIMLFYLFLSRIKNVVECSDIKDFMLLCVLCGGKDSKNNAIDKIISDFADCEPSTVVIYTSHNEQNKDCMIVIINSDCKISGYSESWL